MLAVQTLVSSYEHRLVASEGYIESMGGDHVNSLAHTIYALQIPEKLCQPQVTGTYG